MKKKTEIHIQIISSIKNEFQNNNCLKRSTTFNSKVHLGLVFNFILASLFILNFDSAWNSNSWFILNKELNPDLLNYV